MVFGDTDISAIAQGLGTAVAGALSTSGNNPFTDIFSTGYVATPEPKSNMPLYLAAGAAGVLAIVFLSRRKK